MRWLVSGHKTINKTEEISLLSLISYTAMETDTQVEALQKAFLDSFGIIKVEQLRSDEYDDAIQFIMSWQGGEDAERAVGSY
jgi:hypothetical protein